MAEPAHFGHAPNRPIKSSDSGHDAKDTAEPVPTTSERSLPQRPGWDGPTYYGRSQLKAAPFNKWVVGGYIFLAGLSGSSALVASLAEAVGGAKGAAAGRRGRYLAMLAPTVGSVLLIWDLHTPLRFYNMFRIAKATSPMSIGTWILTAFMSVSGLGFVAQALSDAAPGLGWPLAVARLSSVPAAISGAGLSTYTAALLSATSTPYWAASPKTLAIRFGASSIASGAAALSLGERSPEMKAALQTLGAAALATEFAAAVVSDQIVEKKGVGEALKGRWAKVEKVVVVGVGILLPLGIYAGLRLAGKRSNRLSDLGALATLAGSAMLRVSTIGIGDESASRPEISFRFSQPENLPQNQPQAAARRRRPTPRR